MVDKQEQEPIRFSPRDEEMLEDVMIIHSGMAIAEGAGFAIAACTTAKAAASLKRGEGGMTRMITAGAVTVGLGLSALESFRQARTANQLLGRAAGYNCH